MVSSDGTGKQRHQNTPLLTQLLSRLATLSLLGFFVRTAFGHQRMVE